MSGEYYVTQLDSIERKLDALDTLIRWFINREGRYNMATQATLDRLNADVTANTNAVSAAAAALTGFINTVASLTAQLQAAIAAGDDTAIAAAATALEANNATLTAATPAMAQAIVAGTAAKS
jgi:predicted metal-dependent hydrolase